MSDTAPEVDPIALIDVVAGEPTAEDIAAAKAVVAGMLREGGAVDGGPSVDRWSSAARAGRDPLERGIQTRDDSVR